MKDSLDLAISNIARFGDTDIFPYPLEKKIFFDQKEDVLNLLLNIHENFDDFIQRLPPSNQSTLAPVGYTGFRWATQIDPVWNAYFLGLVIEVASEIEKKRIPVREKTVFSYRYSPNVTTKKLFDENSNWKGFQEETISLCADKEFSHVLICDISDFYSRIYHHRLENALQKLGDGYRLASNRIKILLQKFSDTKSYGLPVGGDAARILSELVLNSTDRLLRTEGIRFCRFADDYHLFAKSKDEAYRTLIRLSQFLLQNEGLSLQKSKSRIMTTEEFCGNSELYKELDEGANERTRFLNLNLHYDPYSPSAQDDYECLKTQVNQFDILGILKTELNSKSRIHKHLTTKLIRSISHLDAKTQYEAVMTLLDNLEMLAPVFPQVMQLIQKIVLNFTEPEQEAVFDKLNRLVLDAKHLVAIELNLHYVVLVLGLKFREEHDQTLHKIYSMTNSELIKKDIILIMAKWAYSPWISDLRNKLTQMGAWEKRCFIVASYILGDEGKHWRDHNKMSFDEFEKIFRNWASKKVKNGNFESLI